MTRLERIADIGLKAGVIALLILVVGVQLGVRHGRWLAARESSPAIVQASTPLRCAQSPETGPVAWTVVDAEAVIQAAQQYLATAEHYQVPALKHAYAAQAEALLRLVELCYAR